MGSEMCIRDRINRYYILEISADLKDRQMQLISGLPKSIRDKVTWLESLEIDPVDGILIANEVIDALPFKRFIIENEQVSELGIILKDGELEQATKKSSKRLIDEVGLISSEIDRKFEEGFASEIRLDFQKWFRGISSLINSCLLYTSPSPRDLSTSRMPSSA